MATTSYLMEHHLKRDMTFIKKRAWPRSNLCIQENTDQTGSPVNPLVFSAIELNEGSGERVDPCSRFMQSMFSIQFIVQQLQSDSDSLFLTVPYDPADISPHLTTARLHTGLQAIFVHNEQY